MAASPHYRRGSGGTVTSVKSQLIALAAAGLVTVTAPAAADARGASEHLESIRGKNAKVVQFLQDMPKGADLHMHLSGAVYAESLIEWGATDGVCLNTTTMAAAYPPCGAGQVEMSAVPTNSRLYNQVLAAWSMRKFTPGLQSGHDHFFAVFDLIGPTLGGTRTGDALAQITQRAADQAEQHVEPMTGPDFSANRSIAAKVPYNPDFAVMRQQMIEAGLFDALPDASEYADVMLERRAQVQKCGTPQASTGCDVSVAFQATVTRNQPPNVVFAQMSFIFELMKTDPTWAGLNMVGQEDGLYSSRDYRLHMKMLQYFRTLYPKSNVALHAGELWPGMVPPSALRFHVRAAVNIAAAQRIGHGVDLRWEKNPKGLMNTMRKQDVCLEANLTSNRQILDIAGKKHPIVDYWKHGVPVVLSTDDEGISRTDLTHQYAQAVNVHGFSYADVKQMARNAITCSFMPASQKKAAHKVQNRMFKKFESAY